MKSWIKKLTAAVLALAVLVPMVSCKEGDDPGSTDYHSGIKIGRDTPWYESREYTLESASEKKKDSSDDLIGCDEKYLCILTTIYHENSGASELDLYDEDNIITLLDRKTGETVKRFDFKEAAGADCYSYNIIYRKGAVEGLVAVFDRKDGSFKYKEVKVDPDTLQVTDERSLDQKYENRSTYDVGDYRLDVFAEFDRDLNVLNVMEITSPDGSRRRVDFKQGNIPESMCPYFFLVGKTKVLFPETAAGESFFYILDMETGKYTKEDAQQYGWLNLRQVNGTYAARDGYTYICKGTGVYKADMEKKTCDEVFNYSWCDISSRALSKLWLADVSDDSLLFYGAVFNMPFWFHGNAKSSVDFKLVGLKKTKNPHAGKRVLELYAPYGKVDEAIYSQIVKFNNTNGKYFIEVTDRYTQETRLDLDILETDDDKEREAYLNFGNALGNKLSMDILNGKGPDMFLNADYFGPLNYKENLADLTPYIGQLEKDKYFTNIIELAKKDGGIYNMPVTINIDGILTDPENAGSSGTGFTTGEYREFLKDRLNGKDIITEGQPYYFLTLFNSMKDKFIAGGKADFTGEEFAALASYVRDNVMPKSSQYDYDPYPSFDDILNGTYNDMMPAYFVTYDTYETYFSSLEMVSYDPVLLGIPSADGRGPSVSLGYSIAVSSHSVNVDACGEFVKMLLSDDVQYEFAKSGKIVLNRDTFKRAGLEAVDFYNSVSINELYLPNYKIKNRKTFDSGHIDALEKTINSCSVMSGSDPDIDKILVEEMPAYFTGQKSLEDVVKIAQNRVQKVLDERG